MTKLQTMARRPFAALALVALAALLGACHHNDDDDHKPPVAETPPPPVATDAFVAYVSQQVATQSDSAEPLSTDGVSATAPEDAEPVPVPGT
jgi:hypothetical protein